jgi:hypothetical protein
MCTDPSLPPATHSSHNPLTNGLAELSASAASGRSGGAVGISSLLTTTYIHTYIHHVVIVRSVAWKRSSSVFGLRRASLQDKYQGRDRTQPFSLRCQCESTPSSWPSPTKMQVGSHCGLRGAVVLLTLLLLLLLLLLPPTCLSETKGPLPCQTHQPPGMQ